MRRSVVGCGIVRAVGAAGLYWTVVLVARMISGFITLMPLS
jgi:hypothetical protein